MTEANPEIAITTETSPVWEAIKERVVQTIDQECREKAKQTDDQEYRQYLIEEVPKISERERKFVTSFLKAFQEAKEKAQEGKIMVLSDFDQTIGYKDPETRKPILRPCASPLLEYLKETEKNLEFYFFTDRGGEFLSTNLPKEFKSHLTEINGSDPRKPTFIYSTFDLGLLYREDDDKKYKGIDQLKQSKAVEKANFSSLEELKDLPDILAKLVVLQQIIKENPNVGAFLVIEDLNYPRLLNDPRIVNLTVESDSIPLGIYTFQV